MPEHEPANIDDRLRAADPAQKVELPTEAHLETLLERAVNAAGAKRGFLAPQRRALLVRGLSTAGVMVAALALVLPSVLGSSNTGNGNYLFSLGSSGTGGGMAATADSKMAAGSMVSGVCQGFDGLPCGYMPTEFHYNAGPALSDTSSNGEIYKLEPWRGPGQTLNALADTFNVHSATTQADTPAGETWRTLFKGYDPANPEPQTDSNISVSYDTRSMIVNWSYNANNMRWTTCEYQDAAQKGQDVPLVDPSKQDPNASSCVVGLSGHAPTTASAVSQAIKYFKALGYNSSTNLSQVKDGDLYLVAPADDNAAGASINVNGYLKVGGSLTSMSMGMGWDGSNSELMYAYGFDAKAQSQGSFGTVSQKSAVDRLGKWQWFGNPYLDWSTLKYSENLNGGAIAIDSTATTTSVGGGSATASVAPAPPADAGVASSAPANPVASSAPGNPGVATATPADPSATPLPEPTPVVVNIDVIKAQNALMTVWGADGSIWFVPGYVYYDSSGYVGNVLSIVEGVIKLPEETPIVMTK